MQFAHVLPGHGEPHRFASPEEARQSLERCIEVRPSCIQFRPLIHPSSYSTRLDSPPSFIQHQQWADGVSRGYTPMWRFRLWAAARVASKNRLLKYLADHFVLGASRQGLPAFAPPTKAKKQTWGFLEVSSPAVLAAVLAAVGGVGMAIVKGAAKEQRGR